MWAGQRSHASVLLSLTPVRRKSESLALIGKTGKASGRRCGSRPGLREARARRGACTEHGGSSLLNGGR